MLPCLHLTRHLHLHLTSHLHLLLPPSCPCTPAGAPASSLGSVRGTTLLNSTDPFYTEFRDLPYDMAVQRWAEEGAGAQGGRRKGQGHMVGGGRGRGTGWAEEGAGAGVEMRGARAGAAEAVLAYAMTPRLWAPLPARYRCGWVVST